MYIIKYLLILVLLLNNALLMQILSKSNEQFTNSSHLEPTFKPNSYFLKYKGAIKGTDFKFNKIETNKIVKTNRLCVGNACITSHDLDFLKNVPKINNSTICLGHQFINKIDLEHLNKFSKVGIIVAYNGDINNLPYNWKICDGTNDTPDLRDRFIMGKNRYSSKETPIDGGSELVTLKTENIPSDIKRFGQGDPINIVPKYYSLFYIMMVKGID